VFTLIYTRWLKYDRDYLCVNKSQFVPVIFEPPCMYIHRYIRGVVGKICHTSEKRFLVALHRCNQIYLNPTSNVYEDNGARTIWPLCSFTYCTYLILCVALSLHFASSSLNEWLSQAIRRRTCHVTYL
jgi:hypothetical protein